MKYLPILLAVALFFSFASFASSEVSIDYSHNVRGTGTIVTDYRIGSEDKQNTEVSGKVRGTGDMLNKYLFQSSNSTRNVTIEDEFVMSKIRTANITRPMLASYPQIPNAPNIVFTGTAWAEKVILPISFSGLNISSELNDTASSGQSQNL
ncbi:MAG: hypothetical protein ACE14P_00440 [Methanotrichaceae archaeon]